MTTHHLKLWPEYFDLVRAGTKTAELRRDDRGFAVGDALLLREWDDFDGYSGRELAVTVTHVLRDLPGLAPGFVVLSFAPPPGFEGVVRVGDTMRMSVELIRDLAQQPDGTSELVRVERIDLAADGSRLMWMSKVEGARA